MSISSPVVERAARLRRGGDEVLVTAHGGALDLRARPEGGLRVSIALPLAPAGQLTGAGVPS